MCVDASGKPDYTSIYVNAMSTHAKVGCFAWNVPSCSVDLRKVQRIEFDFDLINCGPDWIAPLWLSPLNWQMPPETSGEIDFVEACHVGDLKTNFAGGGDQRSIGSPTGLGRPKHIILALENSNSLTAGGTATAQICDLGRVNCRKTSSYPNFMGITTANHGRAASDPYRFISDIWNGLRGDAGYSGCGAHPNGAMQCAYAVRNIKVFTKTGAPIMPAGKCAALNGNDDGMVAPSPPLPKCSPSLSPAAQIPQSICDWVKHERINCHPGHGAEHLRWDPYNYPYGGRSSHMTLEECKAACVRNRDCQGIVMPSNGRPWCYRRANVNVSKCSWDPGYDYYELADHAKARQSLLSQQPADVPSELEVVV